MGGTKTEDFMEISESSIVTMSYVLKNQDASGEVMEVMDIAYLFIFFYKSDHILDSFQENLRGLQSGDTFEFIIPCHEAYGKPKDEEIVDIPIERFVIDDAMGESIQDVGEYVAVTDEQGDKHNGKIIEKTATHLTVDLNHAFAGKDLHFQGRILKVRDASVDEIIQKRYIM